MKRNHYGKVVDSNVATVGVVNNCEPEFLCEDVLSHGIDLDLEEYLAACESEEDEQAVLDTWESGTIAIGFAEWDWEEYLADCEIESGKSPFDTAVELAQELQPLTIVVGRKIFVPDNAWDYQAVSGEIYTQILRSRYVQRCNLCSPCYPGQGDLDSPGDFLAYTVPPVVWGNRLGWREVVNEEEMLRSAEPMPDFAYRPLEDEEEKKYRQWARENFNSGDEIKSVWHPVVNDECRKIEAEYAKGGE